MDTEVAVIGGGVVGLAVAAELARRGRSLVLLERHAGFGRETTSRSSEVVHAGLYYPPGSLKARLCIRGRELLYDRCRRLRIPHRKLGKLVVAAVPGERAGLEALFERATQNGVEGLRWLEGGEVARLEPEVRAEAALLSPESGIVDAHALCDSFAAEAEAHGALVLLRHRVEGLLHEGGGWRLEVRGPDGERTALRSFAVVNAAGLACDRIAAAAGLDVDRLGYRLRYCKGDYFAVAPGARLRLGRLIYPLPPRTGLGIHATLDQSGRVRLGPDAEYVERIDYRVDPAKAARFAEAARRYLPRLETSWLSPESAGIRPRLAGPEERFRDFVVAEESANGLPGLVDLIGIESPGLTAAPALAEEVARLLASL